MATTVYKKSAMLTDKPMHYCPGCAHGLVHKLVALFDCKVKQND